MARRHLKLTNAQWEEKKLLRKQAKEEAKLRELIDSELYLDLTPRPPKLFGYIRCSHLDSVESGLGIDAQRRIILRWAEFVRELYPELTGEIEWIEEQKVIKKVNKAISAYKVELIRRPGGRLLNQQLRKGDHVIFAYLDRAWRNTEDCLATMRRWTARGVAAHFADMRIDSTTAQGKFTLTVLAAAVEMDSHLKSERVKESFSGMMALGKTRNGHAPIGYKLIGKKGTQRAVVPDPEQRIVMAEIARFKESGRHTLQELADHITEWMDKRDIAAGKDPMKRKPMTQWTCERYYKAELKLREKRAQKEKTA